MLILICTSYVYDYMYVVLFYLTTSTSYEIVFCMDLWNGVRGSVVG
jgi:hypothetical protein